MDAKCEECGQLLLAWIECDCCGKVICGICADDYDLCPDCAWEEEA